MLMKSHRRFVTFPQWITHIRLQWTKPLLLTLTERPRLNGKLVGGFNPSPKIWVKKHESIIDQSTIANSGENIACSKPPARKWSAKFCMPNRLTMTDGSPNQSCRTKLISAQCPPKKTYFWLGLTVPSSRSWTPLVLVVNSTAPELPKTPTKRIAIIGGLLC